MAFRRRRWWHGHTIGAWVGRGANSGAVGWGDVARRRVSKDARWAVTAAKVRGAWVVEALTVGHVETWRRLVREVAQVGTLRRGVAAAAFPVVAA